MCGLYASLGFEPDRARIDVVAHRGPDGSGWEVSGSACGQVALGHRRLAIIDLSEGGEQPMRDASGRYSLIFNGEIYNYLELRAEMIALGEHFTTASDSEVLLRAWALWGEAALPRLRGMFAFLIWDRRESRLHAARDRFGIKPLYFCESARGVAFGSEIKQLLGLPGLSGRMNPATVRDFLESGLSDHTAQTMFDGVLQLRGGEYATVDAGRPGRPEIAVRRWHAAGADLLSIGEAEAAERFRTLLADSVALHLRSDVAVGSCLSGGLDSSSIVCLMQARLDAQGAGQRVHTVSACYDEKSVDEKPFMDSVIAATGAKANFIHPRADDVFQRASDITWHQDEPFGSTSIFAQWCVFAEARRVGVKVMLDGQGADEQLAGYHAAFPIHLAAIARSGKLGDVLTMLRERRSQHGEPLGRQIAHALPALLSGRWSGRILRTGRALQGKGWLNDAAFPAAGGDSAQTRAAGALGLPPVTDLRSLCLAMTYATNLPMLLHWEDRNSMAHGVEARVPFLDHPLVEFTLALGGDHKIVGGDTKRVLRRGMAGLVPDHVLNRRDKLGFATPEQAWFRGPLRGLVGDGIARTLSLYPGLFDAAAVRSLASDMLDGRRPVDFRLWRIISLGVWGERFNVAM